MDRIQKAHLLLKQAVSVWSTFKSENGLSDSEVFLCPLHLRAAIDNAIIDMERMVDFHFVQGACADKKMPDNHKYAGFVSRWVAKIRPIRFHRPMAINLTNAQRLELNSVFSVYIMAGFLKFSIPINIARNLRYWFTFREERGETLAMLAYCAEKISSLEDVSSVK